MLLEWSILIDLVPFCSCLQTFVNDVRIQEQSYVTLKMDDKLRFGYDILETRIHLIMR